jgi:hypothetical protein
MRRGVGMPALSVRFGAGVGGSNRGGWLQAGALGAGSGGAAE